MKLLNLIISVSLGIFFISCHKHESDNQQFGNCKGSILTDSLAVRTKLIGSWNWTQRYCPCCAGVKPVKADKKVVVLFKPDGSFSITEESTVINTGTWELQKTATGTTVLLSNQDTGQYLNGWISLCDSELKADQTPVDGCANWFVKQ